MTTDPYHVAPPHHHAHGEAPLHDLPLNPVSLLGGLDAPVVDPVGPAGAVGPAGPLGPVGPLGAVDGVLGMECLCDHFRSFLGSLYLLQSQRVNGVTRLWRYVTCFRDACT